MVEELRKGFRTGEASLRWKKYFQQRMQNGQGAK